MTETMTTTTGPVPEVKISRGVIKEPSIIVLHGTPKIGKSSFSAKAPNPIFADIERGTKHLNVARLPFIDKYADLLTQLKFVRHGKHDHKAFVIDGLEKLATYVEHDIVTQRPTDEKGRSVAHIEDYGWGKGHSYAQDIWDDLFDQLKDIRSSRNMEIILVGHSEVKSEEDIVVGGVYKQYKLQLHPKVAAIVRYHTDAILFATREVLVERDKNGKITSAHIEGKGKRILYTEYSPQWDAGNRLGLPYQLPLSWDTFKEAADKGDPDSPEALKQAINALLTRIKKEQTKQTAQKRLEEAGDDADKLAALRDKLIVIVEERKE